MGGRQPFRLAVGLAAPQLRAPALVVVTSLWPPSYASSTSNTASVAVEPVFYTAPHVFSVVLNRREICKRKEAKEK